MNLRRNQPGSASRYGPTRIWRWACAFLQDLRHVDVDKVGRAMFDHCTSPKALYVTLFERWWVVAMCAFIGSCLGVFIIAKSVEQYEAHGSILIYQKMPTFLDSSMMVPDAKAYDSLFSTHVQLISSELIVEKAIEEHELEARCPGIVEKVEEKLGTEEEITFLDYVRKNLAAGRAGSGDSAGAFVVTLAFSHGSDEECITVVDAVLETYRDHVNQSLLFDQENAFELVKRTKQELETEVTERHRVYLEFISTAPSVWDQTTEKNPHQERVQDLEKQRTELELKRIALLSRIEIMAQTHDSTTGKPLTDIARLALIDEEHIPRLDVLAKIRENEISVANQSAYPKIQEAENVQFDELLKKYAEKAEMLQKIGADHPRVLDHQATIDVLERKLDAFRESQDNLGIRDARLTARELVAAYVRMLNEEYADVTQKLLFLERKIRAEVKLSHELKAFSAKASQLKTEYEQSQQHFQEVMDKTTKQHLLKEFGNFIAEIVGHPKKAELTWPKKPVILGLCTILGIFAGSFLALALDLIAFTPLRSVFKFIPARILGPGTLTNTPDRPKPDEPSFSHSAPHEPNQPVAQVSGLSQQSTRYTLTQRPLELIRALPVEKTQPHPLPNPPRREQPRREQPKPPTVKRQPEKQNRPTDERRREQPEQRRKKTTQPKNPADQTEPKRAPEVVVIPASKPRSLPTQKQKQPRTNVVRNTPNQAKPANPRRMKPVRNIPQRKKGDPEGNDV